MDPEIIEKLYKDLTARFKKAYAKWTSSGNGKDNKNDDGETVDLIVLIANPMIVPIQEMRKAILLSSNTLVVMRSILQ